MRLPLDHIALVGYSLLFAFAAYKLGDTAKRPLDLAANVLLLTGLGTLIAYHYRVITTKKTELTDLAQKRLREVAHASLVGFLVITLLPASKSVFRSFDWFALVAHASLFVAVVLEKSQMLGVALLALYFLFASAHKASTAKGLEFTQLAGRVLLLVYFSVSSYHQFAKGGA